MFMVCATGTSHTGGLQAAAANSSQAIARTTPTLPSSLASMMFTIRLDFFPKNNFLYVMKYSFASRFLFQSLPAKFLSGIVPNISAADSLSHND
jgi:hypothetical protein